MKKTVTLEKQISSWTTLVVEFEGEELKSGYLKSSGTTIHLTPFEIMTLDASIREIKEFGL